MIHRLQRIVQEVNRAPDVDRALVMITESLIRDLNAEACTIFLAQKDDPETLMLQACSGLNPDIIGKVRAQTGPGPDRHHRRAFRGDEPDRCTGAPEVPAGAGIRRRPSFRSCLAVPIIAHRDVLGVISVQRREKAFDEDAEAFLTTLAAQLATSIERAESQGRLGRERTTHMIKGVAGAPGMAIGVALVLNRGVNLESVPDKEASTTSTPNWQSFRDAVRARCARNSPEQAELMRASLPEEECALFIAYAQMLSGGSLIDDTVSKAFVLATGRRPAGAIRSNSTRTYSARWKTVTSPSAPTISAISVCACCAS